MWYWTLNVRVNRYIDIQVGCWTLSVRVYRYIDIRVGCWTLSVRVYRYIDIRVGCWTLSVHVYRLHEVRYGTPDVRVYRSMDTQGVMCGMYRYMGKQRSQFFTDSSEVPNQQGVEHVAVMEPLQGCTAKCIFAALWMTNCVPSFCKTVYIVLIDN